MFDMMGTPYNVCVLQDEASDSFECGNYQFFMFPHLVDVSAFRMLRVRFALIVVIFMRCENVSFESKVTPRIFECLAVCYCCLTVNVEWQSHVCYFGYIDVEITRI